MSKVNGAAKYCIAVLPYWFCKFWEDIGINIMQYIIFSGPSQTTGSIKPGKSCSERSLNNPCKYAGGAR